MGKTIELTAGDGFKLGAYRADPAAKPKGGLVLIQELFGVNRHIRAVADGFAAQGYLTIAPAIFDRAERGVELGYGPADLQRAQPLRAKIPTQQTLADISAAAAAASEGGKVGIIGYCWGGLLVYLAACSVPGLSAGVGYYGGGTVNQVDKVPQIPLMLHFGERDKHIPLADVDKIRTRHPKITVYTYPADHGFNCDERPSFDQASAELALQRTLQFFAQQLR